MMASATRLEKRHADIGVQPDAAERGPRLLGRALQELSRGPLARVLDLLLACQKNR